MAQPPQLDPNNPELDPLAAEMVGRSSTDFAADLIIESKLLARKDRSSYVRPQHVLTALDTVASKRASNARGAVWLLLAGALVGSGAQGFTEGAFDGDIGKMVVYVVMGIGGFLLSLRALLH